MDYWLCARWFLLLADCLLRKHQDCAPTTNCNYNKLWCMECRWQVVNMKMDALLLVTTDRVYGCAVLLVCTVMLVENEWETLCGLC